MKIWSNGSAMSEVVSIVNMHVGVTCLQRSMTKIFQLLDSKNGGYICVSNVHMCMEVFDSKEFRQIVNGADLVIPDGRPLSWAQRLLGYSDAKQVRGQDIMNALCEVSGEKYLKIGLYGGSSDVVLLKVVEQLKAQFPDIVLSYSYAPPFRSLTQEERHLIVKSIREARVDILFVGLGCPKQERWMAEHRASLNCVMLGVGAAFDFIAGSKRHAPRWMQKAGVEWLFRLCAEPTRLWRRYLKQNPRFLYHFFVQYINLKLLNRRNSHD